jgi:small GTP-binding protein
MSSYSIKVVVAGKSATGKTSLVKRIYENTFDENEKATIGIGPYITTATADNGDVYKVHMWDTAGQERFNSLVQSYFRGSCIVVLVYAINSDASFHELDKWLATVQKEAPEAKIFLVGNKCDLSNKDRKVTTEQALAFCVERGLTSFRETSAKTIEGVHELFAEMVHSMIGIRKPFRTREEEEEMHKEAIALGGEECGGGGEDEYDEFRPGRRGGGGGCGC